MMFIAIFFRLDLLCLYLGCLGWRKNQVASVVLLLLALLNLSLALAIATHNFFFH